MNQCLIILGLYLTLAVYMINGCVHIAPKFGEVYPYCKQKWGLGDAEVSDLAHQPPGDMRFKSFAYCFYDGIGYMEDGKLSVNAMAKQVEPTNDPEVQKEIDALLNHAAQLMKEAKEKGDDSEAPYHFLMSTQTPRNAEFILSLLCKN